MVFLSVWFRSLARSLAFICMEMDFVFLVSDFLKLECSSSTTTTSFAITMTMAFSNDGKTLENKPKYIV